MAPNVASKTKGTDPYVLRKQHRLVTVWSTHLTEQSNASNTSQDELLNLFYFGRYSKFVESSIDQLPHPVLSEMLPEGSIKIEANISGKLTDAKIIAFNPPNRRIIFLIEVFVDCNISDLIEVMQDFYYKRIKINELSISDFLSKQFNYSKSHKIDIFDEAYYQFVSLSESQADEDIDHGKVRDIIYRYFDDGLAYRKEFQIDDEYYPPQLNIRKRSLCAISTYVSVVYNHQEYIESTMILSILQYVAAQQSLSILRKRAFRILQDLNDQEFGKISIEDELSRLIRIAKHLEMLNLELSLGVEDVMDLSLIIPSLRSESYHKALFSANDMEGKIGNLGNMLIRIENVLSSNKSITESYEYEKTTLRRSVWAVIASGISIVAIPVTIILSFISAPVLEASKNKSIFDLSANWVLYTSVFGIFLVSFAIGGLVWHSLRIKKHRARKNMFEKIRVLSKNGGV